MHPRIVVPLGRWGRLDPWDRRVRSGRSVPRVFPEPRDLMGLPVRKECKARWDCPVRKAPRELLEPPDQPDRRGQVGLVSTIRCRHRPPRLVLPPSSVLTQSFYRLP